jgi:hypothetical protein
VADLCLLLVDLDGKGSVLEGGGEVLGGALGEAAGDLDPVGLETRLLDDRCRDDSPVEHDGQLTGWTGRALRVALAGDSIEQADAVGATLERR